MRRSRLLQHALLGVACLIATNTYAQGVNAYLTNLDSVETRLIPTPNLQRLAEEDRTDALLGNPPRFAVANAADVSPANTGVWERYDASYDVWRYRVSAALARSLNFGFTKYTLPPSARLTITSIDGKKQLGPFTANDNRDYSQLWTPIIESDDVVIELRVFPSEKSLVVLHLTAINYGYRGFNDAMNAKSGACNMDVNCLTPDEPWATWRSVSRAVGAYTIGGVDTCTGSLLNTSRNDKAMLFATANHCSVGSGNAASMVVYFNFENSTCRLPGSGASGGVGDGPRDHTISGATWLASTSPSDFTIVRLSSAPQPSWNLYWAGWDRNSANHACGPEPDNLCAAIHNPGVDETRITFVEEDYVPTSYGGTTSPGDGTHWWAHWDPTPIFPPNPAQVIPPQVTEGGSSGSPLYTVDQRFVGQLHGGPSACGATGNNLSDYYGRLSVSWEGGGAVTSRARDHLDPDNTGAMTQDGRGECTAPAVPAGITATSTAPNQITVTWSAVPTITTYRIYRSVGACPGAAFAQIGEVTTGTTYVDNTVSGGSAYSYKVTAFDIPQSCESLQSTCSGATATGVCALPPTFSGLGSASSANTASCAINLTWNAATGNCGGGSSLRYNVYRDTASGFTPSAANRINTCATATTAQDTAVASGAQYYYIVRAEDQGAPGSGACGGVEDANTVVRSAAPAGLFEGVTVDDVEGASGNNYALAGTGVGANFAIVTGISNSPTHSWHIDDLAGLADHTMTANYPIVVSGATTYSFWHRYNSESGTGTIGFDGAVLEYSLDGGATWSDILAAQGPVPANAARFTAGGYTHTISGDYGSAISDRRAWAGNSTTFLQSTVNLADFDGRNVLLRFRFASDETVGVAGGGWWIDDMPVAGFGTCGVSPPDPLFTDGFETP